MNKAVIHFSTQHTRIFCNRENYKKGQSRTNPLQVTCPDCLEILSRVTNIKLGRMPEEYRKLTNHPADFIGIRDRVTDETKAGGRSAWLKKFYEQQDLKDGEVITEITLRKRRGDACFSEVGRNSP